MLELDDLQHFLAARPTSKAARYEFLSFRRPDGGCAWLNGMLPKIGSASRAVAPVEADTRWVTVAFTFNGLRALGVDEASLETFPPEFVEGMPARAAVLGDSGANHPDQWTGGLSSPDLHAIVILFASDDKARAHAADEHRRFLAGCAGVEILSSLDLGAIPPFGYPHDHFGYRDRISEPSIEGLGPEPTPGSGPRLKPGEFFLGSPDEEGDGPPLPRPEVLSKNGSFLAYRRMKEHVAEFRAFLKAQAKDPEEE